MLLFQTSREIKFYCQHFIQVRFYFLGKKLGGNGPPGPSPCYGTAIPPPPGEGSQRLKILKKPIHQSININR